MDKRLTFNEDVMNYDKWRPRYCDELFSTIIEYSQLNNKNLAVEIGSGTGQATEPILKTGCSVIAVEYGENLASFASQKFEKYKNLRVQNIEFEKFQCENNTADLVYSATAFHWIPEEIGYRKVFDMLKSDGTIALFWNRPFTNRADDPLHQKIQTIYDRFRDEGKFKEGKLLIEDDTERYQTILNTIRKYGFVNEECYIYKNTRRFNADEYISLLDTYSDHRTLPPLVKEKFVAQMKDAIVSFGGILNVYDTMDLYLAKKP
jgi:SAM-dependent methyltransferase